MSNKIHGVIRTHNTPGRVMNVRSRKNLINHKIRLDKIITSPRPSIKVIRRLGGAGDVIMSLPLLKHIKRLIPHAELTYETDLQYMEGALGEIILHNPYVDNLISNGSSNNNYYDYVVDITTTGLNREKSGFVPPNRIDMFAEEVGVDVSSDPTPDYIVTEQEKVDAQEFILSDLKITNRDDHNIIMVQCRSNDARRTWPLEYVDQLADLLIQDNSKNIVLLMDWGHSTDRWQDRENIFAIKDLSFVKTAALMEQCDLVVCPDSSLLHLAGALNKKTVTIFGPIPPESRINYYPNATAVFVKLRCSFCWYSPSCVDNNKLECLKLVKPEMVLEAINKKMDEDIKLLQSVVYGKDISKGGQDNLIYICRRVGGLGDILMCGPALKALKIKYPDKKIHFAIPKQYIDLMKNLDFIDKVLDVEAPVNYNVYYMIMDISSPCAKYEHARISMNKKVEKSRVEIFAEALGVRHLLDSHIPYYVVTPEEKELAQKILDESKLINKNKKTIAICPRSAEAYRDYEYKNASKLITLLIEEYNVILIGNNNNIVIPEVLEVSDLPIRQWSAILSLCDGFISVDTGPLHIAAALQIPTIGLFGPIDYKVRCKGYKNTTIIKSNLPCIPCWRNAIIKCKQNNLIKAPSKCMDIPPSTIFDITKRKLK